MCCFRICGFLLSAIADVESLWWLCVWCVTYFCTSGRNPTPEHLTALTSSLFPIPYTWRSRAYTFSAVFVPETRCLPEAPALDILNRWRLDILKFYRQVEDTTTTIKDDLTEDVVKSIRPFVDELYAAVDRTPVNMISRGVP